MIKSIVAGIGLLFIALTISAKESYYEIKLENLRLLKGDWHDIESFGNPKQASHSTERWRLKEFYYPRVIIKGKGEGYILFDTKNLRNGFYHDPYEFNAYWKQAQLVVYLEENEKKEGTIFWPQANTLAMIRLDFAFSAPAQNQQEARKNFLLARQNHYKRLWHMEIPGSAWFRSQALSSSGSSSQAQTAEESRPFRNRNSNETEWQRMFAIFNGGRALSENLQLERNLQIFSKQKETIAINALKGIDTLATNWEKDIAGKNPEKDPLAAYIPGDQYAVFFHDFQALARLIDELDQRGTPILQSLESRAEDTQTRDFYQKQIGLGLDELGRLLGSYAISHVAITGSDPFLRTGSDIAVLFHSQQAKLLASFLNLKRQSLWATFKGINSTEAVYRQISYHCLKNKDRSVSSYLAVIDDKTVVVANSLYLIQQTIQAAKAAVQTIAQVPEYTFFRIRYPIKDSRETALVVLSDATIRKWCGPKWRIADSRRIRMAAILAELQARYLSKIKQMNDTAEWIEVSETIDGAGKLWLTPQGISSSLYGGLNFLTPISELNIEKVSAEEASAYEWYRNSYQHEWRQYFDPIAMRFCLSENKIDLDLTVRPLILQSSYRSLMQISGQSLLNEDSGDPHPEALVQYTITLDRQSEPVQAVENLLLQTIPAIGQKLLNWLGNWLSVFIDEDPFWQEMERLSASVADSAMEHFLDKNYNRLPLALEAAIADGLKFSIFLSGLRSFIEQTAPGMLNWQTLNYKGRQYVKVSAKKNDYSSNWGSFSIFYAPTPKAIIISLNEQLIKRFLDRSAIAGKTGQARYKSAVLAEKSLGLVVRGPFLMLVRSLFGEIKRTDFLRRAWNNIPILNEWRFRLAASDPIAFQQKFWQTRLLCPGGGKYVWNEEYQTFASTVFGHPGQPRFQKLIQDPLINIKNLQFGLVFEKDGVRIQTEIEK